MAWAGVTSPPQTAQRHQRISDFAAMLEGAATRCLSGEVMLWTVEIGFAE